MLNTDWMKLHGYDTTVEPIVIDDRIRELIRYIKKNIHVDSYVNKNSLNKNIRDSKRFLKETFTFYPVKHMDADKLIKKFDDKYVDGYCTALAMQGLIPEIDPFKLKIEYRKGLTFDSFVEENCLLSENPEFLAKAPIVFDHISLSTTVPDVTGCLYAHEVMHTQLNSQKHAVTNYMNSEVISIFTELLTAYNNDPSGELLRYIIVSRFAITYRSLNIIDNNENNKNVEMNEYELIENSKYVISFLEALNLFDLYLSNDLRERRYILKDIQRVLDNRRTLEEQLNSLDIDFNNSSVVGLVKRYI